MFQKLGRILENKSALFWHTKSFDRYLGEHINPYGLQIQIFPSSEQIGVYCKKEWEENLRQCSSEMMLILTREYNRQINNVEINILEQALVLYKDHTLFLKFQMKLKDNLSIYNKNILQKRETKFWRDQLAISEERAYKLHLPNLQQRKTHQSSDPKNVDPKKSPYDWTKGASYIL